MSIEPIGAGETLIPSGYSTYEEMDQLFIKNEKQDFALNLKPSDVLRVQGSANSLPLVDASIDVVYCRQLLPFVQRFNKEHHQEVDQIIGEVARVLRPDGVTFLDDEEEVSGSKSVHRRQKLAANLGVVL